MQISHSQHTTLGQPINCSNEQDETNMSVLLWGHGGGVGWGKTGFPLKFHTHTRTHTCNIHAV